MLVPGVATMFRAAQVIPVFHKSARPAVLNRLKPWFRRRHKRSAWEEAGERLKSGASVGVFPEGTMNRHPTRLLRGRSGAAKIALENDVPVVPVGIRFPEHDGRGPISDRERMAIEIGPPIETGSFGRLSKGAVRSLHTALMLELARLSGKEWWPNGPRRRYEHAGQQ